ncbi:MAG: hypothetical protein IJM25_02165 [Eubacterium sp.]|nr:hypothetical protein [Eubacterium sp.]
MERLDAVYLVTTPFQIMSAISLAVNRKERADLYIDVQFAGVEELAERIRARQIFDRVHILDKVRAIDEIRSAGNTAKRYRKMLYWYRHVDEAAAEILLPDREYRILYATHYIIPASLLMLYISKHDLRTKAYFFDDGESSYHLEKFYNSSRGDRMAKKMVLKTKKDRKAKRLYVYSPEVFRKTMAQCPIPVYQLPRFSENKTVQEHLSAIFDVTPEKGIRESMVILDARKGDILSPEDWKRLEELYERMAEELGPENVIIKRHPRDEKNENPKITEYEHQTMPFELICLASSMNKKTLVALHSTATYNPKLLFDQEPRILLLHHLFHRKGWDDAESDQFYGLIRDTYRDPGRVVIPETEEELFRVLAEIRKEQETPDPAAEGER